MNAIRELGYTLVDAWQAADLAARLAEWWWVVTHPELMDGRNISREILTGGQDADSQDQRI